MRIDTGVSYVLHTRAYGETSLIVDLISRGAGRLRGVARGARRRRRGSTAAPCQPFQPLACNVSGRSGLKTIGRVEALGAGLELAGERLFAGLYLNEVLVRTLHEEEPHPEIFDAYEATLAALTMLPAIEPPLRQFELSLLQMLGYGIDFARDAASGSPLSAEALYRYQSEAGFVAVAPGVRDDDALVLRGSDIAAIAAGNWDDPATRRLGKRLTRLALAPLLGHRPLHARALFRSSGT